MFDNLRNLRIERNVSIDTILKILDLKTKAAYYKKETGNVKFTLDEAYKLSIYFKKPIEELFFKEKVS